jgi:hypothetical protein
MTTHTARVIGPTPVRFRSREDLIDQLRSPRTQSAVDEFLQMRQLSLRDLVHMSVASNTFRAYPLRRLGLGLKPSTLYYEWAKAYLDAHAGRFLEAAEDQAYADAVLKAAHDLRAHWHQMTLGRHDVGFGRAAKMFNLTMKHLVLHEAIAADTAKALWRRLHVPLDSFTLQGIATFARTLRLPRAATMNAIVDDQQYNDVQEYLGEICATAGIPLIHYEVLAYNLAHPSASGSSPHAKEPSRPHSNRRSAVTERATSAGQTLRGTDPNAAPVESVL